MTDSLAPSVAGARGPATVPPFDQVSVAVAPGDDLVVRLPGILLVVAVEAVDAPPPAEPQARRLGRGPGGPRTGDAGRRRPGRRARRPVPAGVRRRAVARPAAGCTTSCARGCRRCPTCPPSRSLPRPRRGWRSRWSATAAAEVPDLGLRLTPADGEQKLPDGMPFLDRLVDWPPAALRLSAGSAVTTSPHPLADLESGQRPGCGGRPVPGAGPGARAGARLPVADDDGAAARPRVAAAAAGCGRDAAGRRRRAPAAARPGGRPRRPRTTTAGHAHDDHGHDEHGHAGHAREAARARRGARGPRADGAAGAGAVGVAAGAAGGGGAPRAAAGGLHRAAARGAGDRAGGHPPEGEGLPLLARPPQRPAGAVLQPVRHPDGREDRRVHRGRAPAAGPARLRQRRHGQHGRGLPARPRAGDRPAGAVR